MGLRWQVIVPLAALGLVRPLLSILGVYQRLESPWLSVVVTLVIAAAWVGVVVALRVTSPFITLVIVGGTHGVLAILLQQIIWNIFLGGAPEGAPSSPSILMIGWISMVVINMIWGAVLGLVATAIRRTQNRRVAGAS